MITKLETLQPNLTLVVIDELCLYYSYETLVAFSHSSVNDFHIVCSENVWGSSTGKHLNRIQPNHKSRFKNETFELMYHALFGSLKMVAK